MALEGLEGGADAALDDRSSARLGSGSDPGSAVDVERAQSLIEALLSNLRLVMHAPEEALLFSVLALLAQGHILLEDMPGTGKTTLAKALARSTAMHVSRIQFSPDLQPQDVVGSRYFDQREGRYELLKGPVFANIVVADEINRASPRTQAVMLEVMQERQVTFGMVSYSVPEPFLVLATQNPVEQVGTYELPEAQLDRFMLKLSLGYPPKESERLLVLEQAGPDPLEALSRVVDPGDLRRVIQDVRLAFAHDRVADYVVSLLEATRAERRLSIGASPRAGIALLRLAKAYGLSQGRRYVNFADVRAVAPAVLPHRLRPVDPEVDVASVVAEILAGLPAPRR